MAERTKRADGLSEADHRSLLAIERRAREVLIQCGHLRANAAQQANDRDRFSLIALKAAQATRAADHAMRRYLRERDGPPPPKPKQTKSPAEPAVPFGDRYPSSSRDPRLSAYLPDGNLFSGAARQSLDGDA